MAYRRTARTEERLARTRERIADAALSVVAEGGYRAATVAAVAERAGVATGSVYRHFPSKAELFSEVFRRASGREVEATIAAARAHDGPATMRIAAAIDTFARRALRGRRLAWALIAEPVDPAVEAERLRFRRAYRDGFATVLRDGVASGELRPMNTEVCAAALVGALAEALVGPLAPIAAAPDADALVAELIAFCTHSIEEQAHGHRRAA